MMMMRGMPAIMPGMMPNMPFGMGVVPPPMLRNNLNMGQMPPAGLGQMPNFPQNPMGQNQNRQYGNQFQNNYQRRPFQQNR